MIRTTLWTATMLTALVALPAEARFGKGGGGHVSSHPSSSSPPRKTTHAATPIGGGSSTGYVGGGYGGYYGGGYYQPRWYSGFYYGSFVPYYGYGWGYPASYGYGYGGGVMTGGGAAVEEPPLRVTAGAEAQGYLSGFTLGVNASVEGMRWGFAATAQNMAIRKDDGTAGFDNLQAVSAHLTFAPLTGQYGRIRLEGGADAVFAPNLIAIGPTVGVSGVWWVGGPIALEGSLMYTPWPYTQVDAKAGLGVGLGAVGLRAGWRFQMLNDQGRVDGVSHTDLYNGPYVGLSIVF